MENPNTIRPVFDRVVLRKEVEQNIGGIIIPKSNDDRSSVMQVVAVGEVKNVEVGDRVIIAKYCGTEIKVGADVFTIVCEYDILGVIA